MYSVFFVYLLLCAICIEELKLIEFSFTSYNTIASVHSLQHFAKVFADI